MADASWPLFYFLFCLSWSLLFSIEDQNVVHVFDSVILCFKILDQFLLFFEFSFLSFLLGCLFPSFHFEFKSVDFIHQHLKIINYSVFKIVRFGSGELVSRTFCYSFAVLSSIKVQGSMRLFELVCEEFSFMGLRHHFHFGTGEVHTKFGIETILLFKFQILIFLVLVQAKLFLMASSG